MMELFGPSLSTTNWECHRSKGFGPLVQIFSECQQVFSSMTLHRPCNVMELANLECLLESLTLVSTSPSNLASSFHHHTRHPLPSSMFV
jgi:hypothetical protein